MHAVIETPDFLADAKDAGITDEERSKIVNTLAHTPDIGTEIKGTGGARKVRFAGRGKGKSGGYRVITAYFGPDAPTYLLAILSKGDRANFSAAEIAGFKALTAAIDRFWKARAGR